MCGIVGYIGDKNAVEVILDGLHRLEYRGYDSAGVAVVHDGQLITLKSPGKLSALDAKINGHAMPGSLGIGHTRWATHGAPNERNAHPHLDEPNEIAIVHNGIIENFHELRDDLEASGVELRSDTDSELFAHLIRRHYEGDLFKAVQRALQGVRGAYALGVVCKDNPDVLVVARQGSPLIVGLGENEAYVASDVPAIMKYTRNVLYIADGQVCEVRRDGYRIEDLEGNAQELGVEHVDWDDTAAEKEGYPHFMLKEIHEQPEVLRNALRGRVSEDSGDITIDELGIDAQELIECEKIVVVACGTAWHAGLVGKYLIEKFARVPVEVDIASEYRYRDPIVSSKTIVLAITQSGETADTLEAVRVAKRGGAKVVAVVNVAGSSIAREAAGLIYIHAGPEIGVASTKAYTAQLAALALFTIHLGRTRGTLTADEAKELIDHLRALPDKLQWCIDHQERVRACADNPKYRDAKGAMFIGRSYNYPSALEGALKLKEISYTHVEGYAAGEMKHGPIALVTDELPVICIAVQSAVHEKVISNIQEIRARDGIVLTVATEGDESAVNHSDDIIYVPECFEPFSPMLVAVPLQLLAYYIATNRGCDVDQPRNLAKSVTVE